MSIKKINEFLEGKNFSGAKNCFLKSFGAEVANSQMVSIYIQKIYEINAMSSRFEGLYRKEISNVTAETILANSVMIRKLLEEAQEELDRKLARCFDEI